MSMLITKTKILLGLILITIALPTFANMQEFTTSRQRITASIGAGKQNRIEFAQGRILEVIGNTSQYNLIATPNSSYIFLTPKLSVGRVIDLSIIYSDNKVQELSLYVAAISGQTVFIKQNNEFLSDIRSTKPQNNTEELAEIIRFMALGKTGKYNVEVMKHPLPPLVGRNLNLIFDLKYNFAAAGLIGRRLRVKNNSSKPVKLLESSFEHIFENIIAVNLSKEILKPKEEGFIYLISRLKQWSKQ